MCIVHVYAKSHIGCLLKTRLVYWNRIIDAKLLINMNHVEYFLRNFKDKKFSHLLMCCLIMVSKKNDINGGSR